MERARHIGRTHQILRKQKLVEPRWRAGKHARRRARRTGLGGVLRLWYVARHKIWRRMPSQLRLRALPRNRKLGLYAIYKECRPASRQGGRNLWPPAQTKRGLWRRTGAYRRGINK